MAQERLSKAFEMVNELDVNSQIYKELCSSIDNGGLTYSSIVTALGSNADPQLAYKLFSTYCAGVRIAPELPITINSLKERFYPKSIDEQSLQDLYIGIEKGAGNYNAVMPQEESEKIAKAAAQKRNRQLKILSHWEKSKIPLPPLVRLHGSTDIGRTKDILIGCFSCGVGTRMLLSDAELRLVLGGRYGLIGRNGIGKTTFINQFVRKDIPGMQQDLNIACMEQEFDEHSEKTPLQCVLEVDSERTHLLGEEERLLALPQTTEVALQLQHIYTRLANIEADKAESEACSILGGLGLTEVQYRERKFKHLNGGNRVRVMLARVLFADPDVLCLDEPTNHLDIHAVEWLTNYLNTTHKTCLIVSHSRQFLNDVCTNIIEFVDKQLIYYVGNYDTFEKVKSDKRKNLQKNIESQDRQVAHIQKFVDKFRYSAARAAQVQSRLKKLAKLPRFEELTNDPQLQFSFVDPPDLPSPMLVLQGVTFTYPGTTTTILEDIDFSVDMSSRLAICGVNGSGKSTLLKLIIGENAPNDGFCFRHNQLRIGYFSQHHVDSLDISQSAVSQLKSMYPDAKLTDQAARTYLGKFGIHGMTALEPMFILSGGQKSRVSIALMAFAEPHILVLDEPTNHLDLDAIQALVGALNTFAGGVIIVSHDSHLLQCVAENVYYLTNDDKKLHKFAGDFDNFRRLVLLKKI